MEITSGRIPRAIKTVIYGPEGIGKTTFASRFPYPLFIDTEDSTVHMDVRRLPKPAAWLELLEEIKWVLAHPDSCKTLVIDTADWAETLCNEYVCARDQKTGIEDYGYGKGYVYAQEEFGRLPNLLEQVIAKGIHVVICCHAAMRKFEQPDELGAYDRWEMKLSKKIAPMLREWSDLLLFANYKTIVVNVDNQGAQKGKNKVQGGKRVMYTTHHPCWDAKNRFGLPDEMPFDYEGVRAIIEGNSRDQAENNTSSAPVGAPSPQGEGFTASALARKVEQMTQPAAQPQAQPPTQPAAQPAIPEADIPDALARLMREAEVTPDEVKGVIAMKGFYPFETPWSVICADRDFLNGWIMHPDVWPQIVNTARMRREDKPF